jgi:hypothetical protein
MLLPLFDPTLVDSVYERDKCTDETCPFVTSVHVVDAAVLIVFGIQPFCCNTVITVCVITGNVVDNLLQTGRYNNLQTTCSNATSKKVGLAQPLSLGVDSKIKAHIWANEYIKFETLIA